MPSNIYRVLGYAVEEIVIILLNNILKGSPPFHRIDFYHVGCTFHALLPPPLEF